MRAKLLDPKFQYHSAEASRKPGYLAERFATIYRPKQPTKHEVVALRRTK
jgi:hypothetical protein